MNSTQPGTYLSLSPPLLLMKNLFVFLFALSVAVHAAPKNIILIMADDIAYDNNLGAYGARES